jgi:thiosulfate dehydrogenase
MFLRRVLLRSFAALAMGASLPLAGAADLELGERLAGQGDASRGLKPCAECHGTNGGGSEEIGAPRLAAMGEGYLVRQIDNFRDGNRRHPIMQPWAEALTPDEIQAAAAYYASLPPASNAIVPKDIDLKPGKWLALYGDWPGRRLPACIQCHGPLGVGVGEHFPALAGQPYSYLVGQLADWTAGSRNGDPLGMMSAMNRRLSAQESRSVAAFYASIPARKAVQVAAEIERGELQPDPAKATPPADATARKATQASAHAGPLAYQGEVPAGRPLAEDELFEPPQRGTAPDDDFGALVKLGESIYQHTYSHPVSGKYVGNTQVCEGCHLDAGRLAGAAPMWAAWVSYPAYRSKNNKVNTMTERLQGCFKYSMNAQASEVGAPPSAESRTIHALSSYIYWLATGAPTGDKTMPGRGFPKMAETEQGFDPARGKQVYAEKCAVCHGENGEGAWTAGEEGEKELVFPPLWGPQSYNWGAGMHKIDTAAKFIKANMPLGNFIELSDQDAWDVAAYMNSHERPQDPRFNGDLAETTERFHDSRFDYYGKRKGPDGKLLGEPAPMPTASDQ